VARLVADGEADRYLKEQASGAGDEVRAEADRLRWLATTPLAGHVPRVVSYEPGPPFDRLVTTAVPGRPATEPATGALHVAERFGAALRQVHDRLEPSSCPFDARLGVRLPRLADRVRRGLVDEADFEPEHRGRTAAELLHQIEAERPAREDLVVTHGDWTLENVLFGVDLAWGCIDVAGLGVACRWYDLGIGGRSVADSPGFGAGAVEAFFAGYGTEPEETLLRYYVLVDELQ
jgi:aminoglycoside 3'-phosphotransferase-2